MLTMTNSPKIKPRDYLSVSRIDHKSNKQVSANMDLATLFSDAGACMLMPAVDEGPLCECTTCTQSPLSVTSKRY